MVLLSWTHLSEKPTAIPDDDALLHLPLPTWRQDLFAAMLVLKMRYCTVNRVSVDSTSWSTC